MLSNESEALKSSTNWNDGAEGLTCYRGPIAIHLGVTHPPISCFCFSQWILKVNNVKITVPNTSWKRFFLVDLLSSSDSGYFSRCVMFVIWASLPGHSSPRRVWAWRFESGSRGGEAGSGRDWPGPKGLRPCPARGEGFCRAGWRPRTQQTVPKCAEASSVPHLTRTPRKLPAGWAQRELNLLDAPGCCIIVFSAIPWICCMSRSNRTKKKAACVCPQIK